MVLNLAKFREQDGEPSLEWLVNADPDSSSFKLWDIYQASVKHMKKSQGSCSPNIKGVLCLFLLIVIWFEAFESNNFWLAKPYGITS